MVRALERAVFMNRPCAAQAALSTRLWAPEFVFASRSGVAWYSAVCIGFRVAALLATEGLPFESLGNAAKVELEILAGPNVRAKRATTAGRQARAGENVHRTTSPGLVACRRRPLSSNVRPR